VRAARACSRRFETSPLTTDGVLPDVARWWTSPAANRP
jgi:hypothetical protein